MSEERDSTSVYYISRIGETIVQEVNWRPDEVFEIEGALITCPSEGNSTVYSPGEWFTSKEEAQQAVLGRFDELIEKSQARIEEIRDQKASVKAAFNQES